MDATKSIKLKIVAYLDGELNQAEAQDIVDWMARSEANARYFAKIKDLWEVALRDASRAAGTEKEWGKFVAKTIAHKQAPNVISLNWKRISQMAAVLVVGVLIGGAIFKLSLNEAPAYITASAPKGSVSKIVLPDNTEVFLNAGSEMKYAFERGGKLREVFLNGEAWFRVTHNEKAPFTVHTGFYKVEVLGTEFNVKAYGSDATIETTLEKGSVRIASSGRFKMNKELDLKPGEQVVYTKGPNTVQVKQVETKLYTSWKDNKLEFIKMGLGDLIVLLERRYGVDIQVENKEILQYHYSGTIKNESILEILEIIQHTLPIRYEIIDQTIKIYKATKR
jgi:ferric-dicitrate binding protein FerR (iron transport regulator)